MKEVTNCHALLLSAFIAVLLHASLRAEEPANKLAKPRDAAIAKGIEYLRKHAEDDNGGFSTKLGPGITALATTAMLRHGVSPEDPTVAKALKFLESCVQEDGSITTPKPGTINYDTSTCLECFAAANKGGRYSKIVNGAIAYLAKVQRDEDEDRKPTDVDYGGISYHFKTPGSDLSNTHMMLDALESAGVEPEAPVIAKGLIFVSRCQNLKSEYNTIEFAARVNDGGFYYSPCHAGYGAAGKAEEGGIKSYASMTYCGLKCMLFAGLKPDDIRVKAAIEWLRNNYSVESNTGLGTSGQYYYYYAMARALNALGSPIFEDASGVKHNWRVELTDALLERQQPDGSWKNTDYRWYENDPNLATSFALLALSYCDSGK